MFLFGIGRSQTDDPLQTQADSALSVFKETLISQTYDKSLVAVNKLIQIREKQQDDYEWVRAMSFKAELFRTLADLENALKTIEDAEETAEELPSSTVKSVYYNRRAAILFELKRPNDALEAVKISQRIDEEQNLTWQTFSNLNLEGSIYRDTGKKAKARQVLKQTVKLAKAMKDTIEFVQACYNLGLTYYQAEKFDSGMYYARQILPFKDRVENKAIIDDTYRLIATSFRDKQQFDSAYKYLDSAHVNSLNRMQSIIDSRVDVFKVKNELENEKLQNSVLQAEKKKTQLQIVLLVAGLLILMLLIGIFFTQKQDYKKLNKKQQELNHELEKSLQFKNQLIGIVAHDIRNPMGALKSLIQLYNQGAIGKEDLDSLMQKLDVSASQVNLLLENLLSWVVSQKEEIKAVPTDINIKQLFAQTQGETENQLKQKSIALVIDCPEVTLRADKDMLSLIIRNLLTNAIKFSDQNSNIVLSYQKTDNQHVLQVIDEGVGMSEAQINHLLAGNGESKAGTDEEKGTGLGIQMCIELARANEGKLHFLSETGKGTTAQVFLPIH